MAKRTLTATLPDGQVVSRRTDRTYTHVVAARGVTPTYWYYLADECAASARRARAASAKESVPGSWDAEVARLRLLGDAQVTGRSAHGNQEVSYAAMTWCGRPDLAMKEASKYIRQGYHDVRLVPVDPQGVP